MSQANTGPPPAQPCPRRTGVSKAVAPHLGPHPGEADFTGEPVELAVSHTGAGRARRPPPVCSLAPLPAGSHLAPTPARPPEQGWEPVGKRPAPLLVRPSEVPRGPPQPGLGLKRLLPALPFSFTLVFNPKVKLKTGTMWERW